MEKPVLVVMAAGMGSRYGGLKQMDPVGPGGQVLLDYSIYDALQAGFEKVIFILKEEMLDDFQQQVGRRIAQHMQVEYCLQLLDDLPMGCTRPAERKKPWGTAHAVLAARHLVKGPFAVINADDYYGPEGFRLVYDYLCNHPDGSRYSFAMVGYTLANTLTENGHVSRGVCALDEKGQLRSITEHTRIEKRDGGAAFSEDGGQSFTPISPDSVVSMNLFGLTAPFMEEAQAQFAAFLNQTPASVLEKAEFYLPSVVSSLLQQGRAEVQVLQSGDRWYGVTYQKDKPVVAAALRRLEEEGVYPRHMLGL